MDLTSKKVVKSLLKKHKISPQKQFGQNFLIDRESLKKILVAAELNSNDTVLEIGPGIGTLTKELAKKVEKVIAVEKDRKMIEILKETLKDFKNVKILEKDILKIKELGIKDYKIVANLPYYIVAPIIRKFIETIKIRPKYMILMVQKEVAQRITAKSKMNLLAVSVQLYAKAKIISYVSKKSFWPEPKVDGAIIKLKIKEENLKVNRSSFFKIVKAGFSQPRKQLINNLSQKLKINREKVNEWLLKNNVQPTQRAETLTIEDWIKLTKNYTI